MDNKARLWALDNKIEENKMKTRIFIKSLCVTIFLLISACTNNFSSKTPNTELDFLNISELPNDQKIYSTDLDLYITNKTSDCIVFPYDFGVQIFLKSNGDWAEVQNLNQFASTEDIILTNSSGYEPEAIVFVSPDYSSFPGEPTLAKIILHGYLCQNGKPSTELSSEHIEISLGVGL